MEFQGERIDNKSLVCGYVAIAGDRGFIFNDESLKTVYMFSGELSFLRCLELFGHEVKIDSIKKKNK